MYVRAVDDSSTFLYLMHCQFHLLLIWQRIHLHLLSARLFHFCCAMVIPLYRLVS